MKYGFILPSVEVLILNLINANLCFKRKYSIFKTVTVLCGFTALLFLPLFLLPKETFSGNGEFLLLGFIYIIPLKFLYDEKAEMLLLGMCMSWTYTMGIMSVSIQTVSLFGFLYYDLFLIITETILFTATFFPFKKHMVPQYFYILRSTHIVKKTQLTYLKINIYCNFFLLMILHFIFLKSEEHLLQIAALIIFLASNYLFYYIVYEVISSSVKIHKLKKTVSRDALTGLGNRTQAIKDIRSLIEKNQVFSVIFLDLDRFKLVNDKYGHDIGDRYLIHFGKVFSDELKDKGKLYRYGGDEFVAIYYGVLTEEAADSISRCKNWDKDAPCDFNQVSAGFVVCEPPYTEKDPDNILKCADSIMYRNKESRKNAHTDILSHCNSLKNTTVPPEDK